jgi:glyoxylase-like metal-dependent hydrolase (beta-lactamase superfamily II)
MNRRAILKRALGGVLGLTLPPFARFAFSQGSPAVVPVSEGFVMITGAGGNVLVRTASTGQVLVDSGAAEFTEAVLKRLRELPGAGRVTTVFNTHWHREQVGGNLAFGRLGAKIIAHEKTRAHLATDYYLQDEDRYEKALPAEARPTVTFFAGDQTLAGDKRIEYGHLLEAHTDGDIYVFFRDANVLVRRRLAGRAGRRAGKTLETRQCGDADRAELRSGGGPRRATGRVRHDAHALRSHA